LTYVVTLTTHPAISLPCGTDHAGMPFGLQVVGGFRRDHELLGAAHAMEQAFSTQKALRRPRPDLAALRPAEPALTLSSPRLPCCMHKAPPWRPCQRFDGLTRVPGALVYRDPNSVVVVAGWSSAARRPPCHLAARQSASYASVAQRRVSASAC
jgi:hypothetical protein